MPKVSAVVEEVNEEDKQLRKEFEEFGEVIKDRITDKNRPLLVKKLNHLRARRRMSEKLSQSIAQESSKVHAASRRGRGKKGKSVKKDPSPPALLDEELTTGDGEQLNETFSVSDTDANDISPAKRKKNIPATSDWNTFVASEGPYAVARKRGAAKSQNFLLSSDKPLDEPPESGSTNIVQDGVHTKLFYPGSSQNLDLPANSSKPRRGRTRTVDDLGGKTNTVKILTESEHIDSSGIQQASLAMKRKARVSAVPFAAKLPDDSTREETAGETSSSLNVSARHVKLIVPTVEGRDHSTNRGRQHKIGELNKISEDGGKQNAASRIPKLARFPSPAVSQVCNIKNRRTFIVWYPCFMMTLVRTLLNHALSLTSGVGVASEEDRI